MIRIRPYRSGDFALMPPRPQEIGIEREEAEMDPVRCAHPAWTMFDMTEGVIGAAGVIIFRKGVGEAWLRGSLRFKGHGFAVARYVRAYLDELIRERELHRVQMLVKSDNRTAERFANWLGFWYEGTLSQMGEDRSDYIMMSRVMPVECSPHASPVLDAPSKEVP